MAGRCSGPSQGEKPPRAAPVQRGPAGSSPVSLALVLYVVTATGVLASSMRYLTTDSGVTFGSVLHAVVISSIVGFVVGGMCGWFLGRGMVMVGLVSLAGIGIGAIAGVLALIPLERGWDRQEMMHAGMAILIALMLLGERFNTRDRSFGEQRTGDV